MNSLIYFNACMFAYQFLLNNQTDFNAYVLAQRRRYQAREIYKYFNLVCLAELHNGYLVSTGREDSIIKIWKV